MCDNKIKNHKLLTDSLIIITVIYPGWLYNNGVLDNPFYLPTLSLLIILSTFFSPLLSRNPDWLESKSRFSFTVKDPVVWTSLLFLGYILLQYLNSGALRTFNNGQLAIEPFLYKNLPFSFNQISARKALIWAFTGFAIIVAIRHGIPNKKSFLYIALGLFVNAVLLAVLGLAQYSTHTAKLFWTFDVGNDVFFSTFGYENNGGSFFILMSALALGGILYSIFNLKKKRTLPLIFFTSLFTLFIVSIFPTFTRFCYLESIVLIVFLAFTLIFVFIKKVALRRWLSVIIILLLFTGSTNKEQRGNSQIFKDFNNLVNINNGLVKREFSARTWQWEHTISIWKDYPWFGTGYDNIKYLQGWYERNNKHHLAMLKSPGKANTHNDGLQFLSEFGIVGFTLLLIPIILMLSEAFVYKAWKNGLIFGGLLGVSLNMLHSLIDLPYRNALLVFTTFLVIATGSTIYKPKSNKLECKPSQLFKVISILLLSVGLLFAAYTTIAPFVQSHFMERYEACPKEMIAQRTTYLNLADAAWFSDAKVKSAKAKLLYNDWEKTEELSTLKSAALAIHYAYFTDLTQIENALLFSKIMEKLSYNWEAWISLKILRDQYPKNKQIEDSLYFYSLRHGHKVKLRTEFLLIK